jgi:hypothetical protein
MSPFAGLAFHPLDGILQVCETQHDVAMGIRHLWLPAPVAVGCGAGPCHSPAAMQAKELTHHDSLASTAARITARTHPWPVPKQALLYTQALFIVPMHAGAAVYSCALHRANALPHARAAAVRNGVLDDQYP